MRSFNWVVATPVVTILLLYCMPVIVSPQPSAGLPCHAPEQSVVSTLEPGAVGIGIGSNRTCTLQPGWDVEASFGPGLLPSDMATFLSQASLYCSVRAHSTVERGHVACTL